MSNEKWVTLAEHIQLYDNDWCCQCCQRLVKIHRISLCCRSTAHRYVIRRHVITHFGRLQCHVQQCRMFVHDHEVQFPRLVAIAKHFQLVDARQQNTPEFTVSRRLETDVTAFDLQSGPFDRSTRRIHHEALNAAMRFGQEFHQRQLIVLPVFAELVSRREFAAAHLERDLHAAEPYVVVVLERNVRLTQKMKLNF